MDSHIVNMGQMKVKKDSGTLICLGLGSCVGIVLYDPVTKVGGIAHVMLPVETMHEARSRKQDEYTPAKFADRAVEFMIQKMVCHGSNRRSIKAMLFGGANMFPNLITDQLLDIGKRNIEVVKQELVRFQIELVAEEVGGFVGRAVGINLSNGEIWMQWFNEQGGFYEREREGAWQGSSNCYFPTSE